MSIQQTDEDEIHVSAENIGGIDSTSAEFTPGITILAGRNATNRTSFLRAMMAGLGSDDVSLKGDSKRGSVDLTIGNETYTRTLKRTNGAVTTRGDPYLDDPEVADLFAFLLETNEARLAVEHDDDLRELIMRPVDTEAIQADIRRLQAEKRSLDEELDELEELSQELPALEERRTALSTQIEEKQAELDAKTDELDEADEEIRRNKETKSELESKLSELRSKRSTLEDIRYDLDTERESLEHVREELANLDDDFNDSTDAVGVELETIEDQIATIRDRKQSLDAEINDLQSIIRFNEDMLEGTSTDVVEALRDKSDGEDDGDVTDQLLADEGRVTCWTCGTEVERQQIDATLDRLRSLREEKLDERSSITDELDELIDERDGIEKQRKRRERVEQRREQLAEQIDRREDRINDREERRKELSEEIDDLEATVEDLESEEYDEVIELHREVSTLESERNRLEDERRSVESEIDEIEERLDEREQLEQQREEVQNALQDRRTQVEQIERQAVDNFNEHMETILELLDYGNLDRIWIERTGESGLSGESSEFHLHVVRTTDSGEAYEDTIGHLSESEREVTGIIFALAGYLVHDVYEEVPVMLLDSLEAIDADRIARLVEYIGDHAEYLLVALLTEDAAALNDDYERITEV